MTRDVLRQQIKDYLGIRSEVFTVTWDIVSCEDCGDYSRVLIQYKGSEGDKVPAYLLLPPGKKPFPAVLIHHQHNSERYFGKSEVCGLAGNPLQAFGVALVKKGFVVLAPDSICFEDRRKNMKGIIPDENNDFLQHYNEMCYRILKGSSLMKKVIDDANIGINLLMHHEMVDPKRIGVLGHSYGGNTVLFQTALNEVIAYACSSGAACTYKDKIQNNTGIEMAEVIPGFISSYEISDLVKCIAPRYLFILSATDDKYSRDAEYIEEHGRGEYDALGVNENFVHKRYIGGHALTEERFDDIVQWMEVTAAKV
jgi:dienelactone hydrolase